MSYSNYYCLPLLGLSFGISSQLATAEEHIKSKKPNILFILTDDQSYNTIHALGNNTIVTPNMDRLVMEGTSLKETHVMGALGGAVSMPSRAMLLTGRYLYNIHKGGEYIPKEEKTFPEVFREHNYVTFATGKWHNDKASFNRSFAKGANIFFGGMHPYKTDGHFKPLLHQYDASGKYEQGIYNDKFSSQCYADAAVDFLKKREKKDNPFLMYVAFTSPHDPRTPPVEYGHKYSAKDISLPLNFLLQHPFDNGELAIRDETLLPVPRDPDAVKNEIAHYYGMISEVDTQIGRILDALKASGEYDNTIVVFTADNGLSVGQHGLLGKQNMYEHSTKIPFVISGPGMPKNQQNESYCYLLDIFPTLCELCNIKIPSTVDGMSLNNAIIEGSNKGRNHILLSYINLQRAIKKDGIKLIHYNVGGQRRIQLFDLKNDPLETNNLADAPVYADKLKELSDLLKLEMRNMGDFCDPEKPDWGYPKKLSWQEALLISNVNQ